MSHTGITPRAMCLYILLTTHHATGIGQYEYFHDRLTHDLFSNYNKRTRPSHGGEATDVFLVFEPRSVLSLDEITQSLRMSVSMYLFWSDHRLSWKPSDYGNISDIYIPQTELWLPPITVTNSVSRRQQFGFDENLVFVAQGMVAWTVFQVLDISCNIQVSYYPFDVQKCTTNVMFLPLTVKELNSRPYPGDQMNLGVFLSSGTWDLAGYYCHSLGPDPDHSWLQTAMTYTLVFRRRSTHYVINIVLPVVCLSLTASAVFLLPVETGDKMSVGVTLLLAYSVYVSSIADDLPQTSAQVCYLQVYLTLLLALTALGVLLSVLVMKLHHRSDDVIIGPVTKSCVHWLRRVTFMDRNRVRRGAQISPEVDDFYERTQKGIDNSDIWS